MNQTAIMIQTLRVQEDELGVVFMGQAGFILKSPSGATMGIDLYLSNCCERYFGFKRLMPYLLSPEELRLDYVLASHAHYDHFDPDSIPMLLANGHTRLLIARDCAAECERLGISQGDYTVMREGERISTDDFDILPIPCDHGQDTPYALGFLITCGERRFCLAGDTRLRRDYARAMADMRIEICAAPINGVYGNMCAREAVEFFSIIRPRVCIPCHYWNFAQHLGDPNAFIEAMETLPEHPDYLLMRPGEAYVFGIDATRSFL